MGKVLDEEIVKKMIICSRYLRHYRHKNIAQDRVIELIGANGGKVSQKEIQQQLEIRAASVSELVSKLDNRGLVRKEKSEEDRRAFNLVLTEAGMDEYQKLIEAEDKYEGLFSILSEEESEMLNRILEKLGDEWLSREPSILENQHRKGAKIVRNEDGRYDVNL